MYVYSIQEENKRTSQRERSVRERERDREEREGEIVNYQLKAGAQV